ncbi:hypothetical protein VNI00_016206 [Paramarasmius palmivorus]|uniref:Uncharacterized protein n=1 Tax=Paramarasmius palmivorus TaxID=297713 RepID=A0AAW0BF02_9AGAR
MLRAWFHYGTARPPVLRRVEHLLWGQLFGMARGEMTAMSALKSFIKDTVPLLASSSTEKGFFRPDFGDIAVMPIGIAYESSRPSKEFFALAIAQREGIPGVERDNTSHQVPEEGFNVHQCDLRTNVAQNTGSLGEFHACFADSVPSRFRVSPLVKAEFTEQTTPLHRKTRTGQCEGRMSDRGVVCASVLNVEQKGSCKMSMDVVPMKAMSTVAVKGLTSSSAMDNARQELPRNLQEACVEGVHVQMLDQYSALEEPESLLEILLQRHLVILAGNRVRPHESLGVSALRKIGSSSVRWQLVDVSLRRHSLSQAEYSVLASFSEFAMHLNACRHGKILYFPEISAVDQEPLTWALASSRLSCQYTLGLLGSEQVRDTFPVTDVSWYLLGTCDVTHSVDCAPCGFNLELHVEEGSIVVFVGHCGSDSGFSTNVHNLAMKGQLLQRGMPDSVGMLLTQGDRMCVCFRARIVSRLMCAVKHHSRGFSLLHCYAGGYDVPVHSFL